MQFSESTVLLTRSGVEHAQMASKPWLWMVFGLQWPSSWSALIHYVMSQNSSILFRTKTLPFTDSGNSWTPPSPARPPILGSIICLLPRGHSNKGRSSTESILTFPQIIVFGYVLHYHTSPQNLTLLEHTTTDAVTLHSLHNEQIRPNNAFIILYGSSIMMFFWLCK